MRKFSRLGKLLCFVLVLIMAIPMLACAPRKIDMNKPMENYEVYHDENYRVNLVKDKCFEQGFFCNAPTDPVWGDLSYDSATIKGNLTYNGTTSNPVWNISTHHSSYSFADSERGYDVCEIYEDIDEGFDLDENGKQSTTKYKTYKYSTPGSAITVIPQRRKVSLYVKGSNEFSEDVDGDGVRDGTIMKPWGPGLQWPHLLLESVLSNPYTGQNVQLKDLDKLSFEVDLRMDRHDNVTVDRGLNIDNPYAAQLTMYFMIYSNHPSTAGKYFWLGLNIFDSRYSYNGTHGTMWMYDDATKSWMYGTGMAPVIGTKYFEDGKVYNVKMDGQDGRKDLLYYVSDALRKVKADDRTKQAWKDVTMEHLYISDFNLGWELTGMYDAQISFEDFSVFATYKDGTGYSPKEIEKSSEYNKMK